MKLYRLVTFVVVIGLISCSTSSKKTLDSGKMDYGRGMAYEQANYGGQAIPLSGGTYEPDLFHPKVLNNMDSTQKNVQSYSGTISSLRIGAGLQCEFYQDIDSKGSKVGPVGEGNYPDFRENGWNDKIKSIKCYPAN
ncbi:MAG: hypothetical protein PHN75_04460 [Syntrophales bacterium]|nr:hypothetical protein [Syntrophales bacterium]